MVKGRPPLNPRIEALEKRIQELEEAVLALAALMGKPKLEYQSQFQKWPVNGS